MSADPTASETANTPQDSLQFERAEFAQNAPVSCSFCKAPATGEYFQVNGQTACPRCHARLQGAMLGGSKAARFLRALGAGIAAGAAGFLVFWGIRAATGYEFALVAILVGWLVGAAVRWGSNQRGGLVYQLLGVVLTYFAIVSTYMPDIIGGMRESRVERQLSQSQTPGKPTNPAEVTDASARAQPTPANEVGDVPFIFELIVSFILALGAPFLMGMSNVIGWIIIAVGLMQAWRFNKRAPLVVSGPFHSGSAPAVVSP